MSRREVVPGQRFAEGLCKLLIEAHRSGTNPGDVVAVLVEQLALVLAECDMKDRASVHAMIDQTWDRCEELVRGQERVDQPAKFKA